VKAQDIQHEGALQMQHNNRQEKGWGNKQTNKPLKKKIKNKGQTTNISTNSTCCLSE